MALDPKQVIQKNILLVVCYVAAVVPVVLWVLMVVNGVQGGPKDSYKSVATMLRSKKSGLQQMASAIAADPSQVYTPEHTKKFKDRNTELDAQFNAMIGLVQERDNALEKWLPTLGDVPAGKLPSTNDFQTKLNTAMDSLKHDFLPIVEDPSTKALYIALEPVADGTQKKLQKQYWILQKCLEALKKGGTATATDPTPVRLLSTIEFPPVVAAATPSVAPGQTPPKPLMSSIPVKIIASMSLRDLPKVVRELLAQDIVFRLHAIHTELLPFSIAKGDVGLVVNPDAKPLYQQTIYNATLASQDKKPADEETWFPEPKQKITIELEAVDFEMEAITPPPPAAPVEQPQDTPPPSNNKKKKAE